MSPKIDPITQWLNAAGRKPLLPKNEILRLAREIQSLPEGSPKRIKNINKMVEHNLLLVANHVAKYARCKNERRWGSESTQDFLQAGALGLRRAAEKYDPTRGYTFATYAMFWIRSFVGRQNGREISSIYVPEDSLRYANAYMTHGETGKVRTFSKKNAREYTEMVMMALNPLSMDYVLDDQSNWAEMLPDTRNTSTRELNGKFSVDIEMYLQQSGLTDEAITLLRYRYIDGMTYDEISSVTGDSCNHIRWTCESSIKTLRANADREKLAI